MGSGSYKNKMKTLVQLSELLSEAIEKMPKEGPKDGWTNHLVGQDVAKHLSKNQFKAIVNDSDYAAHVKHSKHIPVFKVNKSESNIKKVKVGNTAGTHHVEYSVSNAGKLLSKIVYEKEDQHIHSGVKWRVASFEDIKAKEEKEKAKK
jgi:CTP:phosphocholine cytidylyltransferase-like protein